MNYFAPAGTYFFLKMPKRYREEKRRKKKNRKEKKRSRQYKDWTEAHYSLSVQLI
jgi:hypothetical protein